MKILNAVRRSASDTVIALAITALMAFSAAPVLAATASEPGLATTLEDIALYNEAKPYGALTLSAERAPTATYTIPVTAYNSLPGQTDDSPYTTAMQTPTRHGVVAANFLPLGTRVKIPELYGDEIFIVEDRMNARYDKKMDIWMEDLSDARQFGLHYVTIEVYRGK